jgi:hypothetical protein
MRILNVHQRELAAPHAEVGALLDSLASDDDALWPGRMWPRMHFDRPLAVGASGGHGPVAYAVEDYRPGQMIQFRFLGPRGFHGHHRFELVSSSESKTLLRHTIDARITGPALITWPVAIRPLHDALLEDALAQAQASLGLTPVLAPWSIWVKLLRWLMFGGRARPQQTPIPAANRTGEKGRADRLR